MFNFTIFKIFYDDLKNYLNNFLWKSPCHIVLTIIVAFCSFGQHFIYNTYNNDFVWFINSSTTMMLHQKRWGRSFLGCIGLLDRDVPLWSDFLGCILFVLAGLLFTFIFHKLSNSAFSQRSRLIFLLIFLSYPLNYTLTVYPTFVLELGICYSLIALAFITGLYYHEGIKDYSSLASVIILLAMVFATYESFVFVFVLCCELYIIWLLLSGKLSTWKQIFECIKIFILIFAFAFMVYFTIIAIISIFIDYSSSGGGAHKQILWLSPNIVNNMVKCLFFILYKYFYIGIFHFAILSFGFSLFIFFMLPFKVKSNRGKILFLFLTVLATLFALSFIQGQVQLYRTCQTFPLFIGSIWMFYFNLEEKSKNIAYIIVFFIILFQMKEMCLMQNADRVSSEKNYHDILKAGYDIKHTNLLDKKAVIVLGRMYETDYDVRVTMTHPLFLSFPRLKTKPIFETVGHDILTGGGSSNRNCQLFFKYFTDIDIKLISFEEENSLARKAVEENMPSFPEEGYIKDCGDYLLVNMGAKPVSPSTNTALEKMKQKILPQVKNKNK